MVFVRFALFALTERCDLRRSLHKPRPVHKWRVGGVRGMFYCGLMSTVDPDRLRGRGARSNRAGRYLSQTRERFDDGWGWEALPPLRTHVQQEQARSILTKNRSPDIGFDRSVNPYRGCEHGCIYCFARPSHAYLDLSPGVDFETQLTVKPNAADMLRVALGRPRYRPGTIAIGTNTDPYQPIEKEWGVMRQVLEVLADHRHPVSIVTKGALIERDLDILADMAAQGLVNVGISVTTLDPAVSRAMEPRVPAPARRLRTIRRLTEAGVPVRVMASPMIPALTDHELEAILTASAEAGASSARMIVLRLPREVAALFTEWLHEAFPDRAARILARVRELHGGQLYDAQWGQRMTGQGTWAALMHQRFGVAAKRLGLDRDLAKLRNDLFRVPGAQLGLFDLPD